MIFRFEPERITKQMLLEQHSEEEYMSFYLGIIPDKGMHCNPLRVDKKPTASFYRARNGELIFKDFQTGFHGNFTDVVMEKFKVEYTKAVRIIANDFGIIEKQGEAKNQPAVKYDGSKIVEKSETVIQCEIKEYTKEELQWWNAFGVTDETLKKYNVFSVKNLFLNGAYLLTANSKSPAYGYYFGKEDGRELWKIYFPLKTQFRFLLNTNKLQGAKQLPKEGDFVVVTKSMKDVMVLHELGIPAVAPQAESVIINANQYKALAKRFKYVIFNGDWDAAGQRFMAESRRRYKSICFSFTNKLADGKDISDHVKLHGIESAKSIVTQLKYDIENGLYNYQLRYSETQ
jgi:hypothetical protein